MTARYQVSEDMYDIEHRCCYSCSIVDTSEPYTYRPGHFCAVAEFKDKALAQQTCDLLNGATNANL